MTERPVQYHIDDPVIPWVCDGPAAWDYMDAIEAERDDLARELREAIVLLEASHDSTAVVAQGTKYRHMDGCSICAFLASHKEANSDT